MTCDFFWLTDDQFARSDRLHRASDGFLRRRVVEVLNLSDRHWLPNGRRLTPVTATTDAWWSGKFADPKSIVRPPCRRQLRSDARGRPIRRSAFPRGELFLRGSRRPPLLRRGISRAAWIDSNQSYPAAEGIGSP